ncbi:hypothetical protein [Lachnoclostridium sp. An169]|uniref:hypothetical protein n=1 Tax=Lachnoclostridium sp. An169 TaxID=1965569 RepID=UPI0013A64D73|nr:hypothetical protein [Lachnoclostridium sp. An169]HJA68386.1 hypothetical protein [Candidatus Mediterraneibacter cottocaccae]
MSTIALNNNAYAGARRNKTSLKERLRKYLEENAATISAGLMMMNGNTSAYEVYRLLKK